TEADTRFASASHIRMALQVGNVSRAIDELKLRVSNDDQDASSRILLARLIYQQNKEAIKQALTYLDQAEAITPGSLALTAARVSILKAQGEDEETRRILNDYVADSNTFGAYMLRAAYLADKGEFERAEQDYRKLTTFADQGAVGYELLSNFYANPRNENLDKAIEAVEEGLNVYPENLRLKRRLMKLLFARSNETDREKAIEILAALEEQMPQDSELMKLRAVQMLKQTTPDSIKAAKAKLEEVIKLDPTAIDTHLLLIGIAMQDKEYETAHNYAIRALGSNPDNSSLLLARGRTELALENPRMAAELANLVLQKYPNSTEARDVLVSAALKSEDRSLLEDARKLIESGLGSDPANEQLLISRARVLVALESPQNAIPGLKAYCQTEKGRSNVAALMTLADLYRLSGEMEQAKLWIEQAELIDPKNQSVIHARLLLLVAQNRLDEIGNISSAYLSATEQNPSTLVAAASILTSMDSTALKKEGLKLYEQAAILSPAFLSARLGLASTLYQTGDAQGAKQTYQKLLDEYPNNIQALNDLAWILQEHDQHYDAALELVNRGIRTSRNEKDRLHLLDTRGTILSNMPDRLADARTDFQTLVDASPDDTYQKAKALLKLGRICLKLDDLVQAKQHMKNAFEIDQKINVLTPDERSEITRILQGNGKP
ncbi:MAG: tetratricopeptide repeat protein, partial [Sedimentisphaerales bacterium]|nr:tetratricopeptide repeat protein [Sedimentisphaerales bacterium]